MARTSPRVLTEIADGRSYRVDQVVEASGIWTVFYEGQPFNLRTVHLLDKDAPAKYKKTSFSNPGHARNLCRKLNARFHTNKFTVVFMNTGEQVSV